MLRYRYSYQPALGHFTHYTRHLVGKSMCMPQPPWNVSPELRLTMQKAPSGPVCEFVYIWAKEQYTSRGSRLAPHEVLSDLMQCSGSTICAIFLGQATDISRNSRYLTFSSPVTLAPDLPTGVKPQSLACFFFVTRQCHHHLAWSVLQLVSGRWTHSVQSLKLRPIDILRCH